MKDFAVDRSKSDILVTKIDWPNRIIFCNLNPEGNIIKHNFSISVTILKKINSPIYIIIENAHKAIFPRGWYYYKPFIKYSKKYSRLSTTFYDGKKYILKVDKCDKDFIINWYEPYTVNRYNNFISKLLKEKEICFIDHGDNLHEFQFGNPSLPCFFILARQHPGESMASFFIEYLLTMLAKRHTRVKAILKKYYIRVFPLINYQGVSNNNHRLDDLGIDYNRSWVLESKVPKIKLLISLLKRTHKLHAFFDIHGDETDQINYLYYWQSNLSAKSKRDQYNLINCLKQRTDNLRTIEKKNGEFDFLLDKIHLKFSSQEGVASVFVNEQLRKIAITYEICSHTTDVTGCYEMADSFIAALHDYSL